MAIAPFTAGAGDHADPLDGGEPQGRVGGEEQAFAEASGRSAGRDEDGPSRPGASPVTRTGSPLDRPAEQVQRPRLGTAAPGVGTPAQRLSVSNLKQRTEFTVDPLHRDDMPRMTDGEAQAFSDKMRRQDEGPVEVPNGRSVLADNSGQRTGRQLLARRTGPDSIQLATFDRPLDDNNHTTGPARGVEGAEFQRGDLSPGGQHLLMRELIPGGPIPRDSAARKADNDEILAQFRRDFPGGRTSRVHDRAASSLRKYGEMSVNNPSFPLLRELKADVGGDMRASANPHVRRALAPESNMGNDKVFASAVDRLARGHAALKSKPRSSAGPNGEHVIAQFQRHQTPGERQNASGASSMLRHAGGIIEQNPDMGLPSLEQLALRDGNSRQDPDVKRIKNKLVAEDRTVAAGRLDAAMDRLRATYRENPRIPRYAAAVEAGPSTSAPTARTPVGSDPSATINAPARTDSGESSRAIGPNGPQEKD